MSYSKFQTSLWVLDAPDRLFVCFYTKYWSIALSKWIHICICKYSMWFISGRCGSDSDFPSLSDISCFPPSCFQVCFFSYLFCLISLWTFTLFHFICCSPNPHFILICQLRAVTTERAGGAARWTEALARVTYCSFNDRHSRYCDISHGLVSISCSSPQTRWSEWPENAGTFHRH